jgi:hypothetical protein
MASNTDLWIQIGLGIGSMICATLVWYLRKQELKGIEYLCNAEKLEGPEKVQIINRAIDFQKAQLARKDLFKEGRAEQAENLGLAYEMLANVQNRTANEALASRAYQESIDWTLKGRNWKKYIERTMRLGNIYMKWTMDGDRARNLRDAIAEYNKALQTLELRFPKNRLLRKEIISKLVGVDFRYAFEINDPRPLKDALSLINNQLSKLGPREENGFFYFYLDEHSILIELLAFFENPTINLKKAIEETNQMIFFAIKINRPDLLLKHKISMVRIYRKLASLETPQENLNNACNILLEIQDGANGMDPSTIEDLQKTIDETIKMIQGEAPLPSMQKSLIQQKNQLFSKSDN